MPLQREHVRFTQIDRFAMRTKRLKGRSSPSITHSATPVIEFTATLGVISVNGPVLPTPDTSTGIHTVFGEKRQNALCYIDRENLVPSFFDDVMDGGYPLSPLWRHDTSRHVGWFGLYLRDACPGVIRSQILSWRRWIRRKKQRKKRSREGESISALICMES